jgi:hypothetical protein
MESTPYSMRRGPTVAVGGRTFNDMIPDADEIAEPLLLIFCDQEAAIQNATRARSIKHRGSYDEKMLNNVLGVAVEPTFGVELSYNFDHFDCSKDDEEVSIDQLYVRMAKSAVQWKRELDGGIATELSVLHRLKDNIVAAWNQEVVEDKMKSMERVI